MRSLLVKRVKDFLTQHWKEGTPVLVALSGGVDSSALFSLLLECRQFFALDLQVAHFDHGWREESALEAALLEEYVTGLGIPFFCERSSSFGGEGNLEEKAREERFHFLGKVYRRIGAQAILLAHQREDQAETILKRIFEGAGALSLGGMQEVGRFEEMNLWRPLLSIPRQELVKWNESQRWAPFLDRTNADNRFLRPRMRSELFPELERMFGKNIRQSLLRVGEESNLVKKSFYKRLKSFLSCQIKGVLGKALPVMDFEELDSFERQELVRLFLEEVEICLHRNTLKKIVALLEEKKSNKEVDVPIGVLLIERGDLIWLKKEPAIFQGRFPLDQDSFLLEQEGRTWEVRLGNAPEKAGRFSFLQGVTAYRISDRKGLVLSSFDLLKEKDQEKVSGYLSKNKVPSKLKRMFPFITRNDSLILDFFYFEDVLASNKSSVFSHIILNS